MIKLEFPKGFLWGSATSAHQVEGGNFNDWTEWERKNAERLAKESKNKFTSPDFIRFPEMSKTENYISGKACDHYNRFREDFDIAKQLGHNAHRFSIEWSRIEPEEGKFDEKEIEHYRKVISALREREIEPFVTLWHWTVPTWFRDKGGWLCKDAPKYFERYVKKITTSCSNVDFWITLNEPDDIYAFDAYFAHRFPPQHKSALETWKVLKNLVKAHKNAYKIIHKNNPQAKVGFANNTICFESKGSIAKIIKIFANRFWNFWFLKRTLMFNDFIGCNYYYRNILKGFKYNQNENKKVKDTDTEIHAKGIYYVLRGLKKYNKPIYIMENGLADAKDEKREKFIKEHLFYVHKAIQEGVDVCGYFYWSLLDNFEWDKGFGPGLAWWKLIMGIWKEKFARALLNMPRFVKQIF